MSTQFSESPSTLASTIERSAPPSAPPRRRRASSPARSLLANAEPLIWLTGGALVLAIVMIVGLLALVATLGFDTFRARPLIQLRLRDGRVLMGEVAKRDRTTLTADVVAGEGPEAQRWLVDRLLQTSNADKRLVGELRKRVDRLKMEADDVKRRQVQTQRQIDRSARSVHTETTAQDNPFVRRNQIQQAPTTQHMQQVRARHVALEQRAAALRAEIDVAEQAVAYFRQLPQLDAQSILNAAPMARRGAIDGLILLAKQTDPASVQFGRRMLRTGNFELTNEHFHWVSDYEIADGGESRPPHGTLIERVAWGRFYGEPQSFVVKHSRPETQDERELAMLLEFCRAHQPAMADDDESSARITAQLKQLQSEFDQQRSRATQAFSRKLLQSLSRYQRLTLQTAAGEAKPADQLTADDEVVLGVVAVDEPLAAWTEFQRTHPQVLRWRHRREHLEKHALGAQFARQEAARLKVRQAELDHGSSLLQQAETLLQIERELSALREREEHAEVIVAIARRRFGISTELLSRLIRLVDTQKLEMRRDRAAKSAEQSELHLQLDHLPLAAQRAVFDYVAVEQKSAKASAAIREEIDDLRERESRYELQMMTTDGQSTTLAASEIVRAFQPNRLSRASAISVYLSRWWEFISQDPREANSEGGVMPAIWGTIVMTLIMSIAVVPFGVVAALYLREYAKSGPMVSVMRIAINNLAGVPSIVFGVFGLGFFCYIVGSYLDGGPRNTGIQPLPPARWYATLAALALTAMAAFALWLFSLQDRPGARRRRQHLFGHAALASWLLATILMVIVVFKTPFFSGFYEANLPNPHWGKGGVVWGALTLALLTLPVVIVATEEALSAVPNSMREGSFGCGASRWQTICRIVLPHAMPGIMTGMILAMARGAGEVAPLMLVGAVKLAPELPIDLTYPFLHGNRSFMHLGFHVFDVGFQSQNSEAAKPMVYTTTLLLILIITVLNLLAIRLRAYLKRRFVTGHF